LKSRRLFFVCDAGAEAAGAGECGCSLAFVGTIRAYSAYCPARISIRAEKAAVLCDRRSPDEQTIRNEPAGSFLAIDLVDRSRQQLTRSLVQRNTSDVLLALHNTEVNYVTGLFQKSIAFGIAFN